MALRVCKRCCEVLPLEAFRVSRGYRLRTCTDCTNDLQRIRDRKKRAKDHWMRRIRKQTGRDPHEHDRRRILDARRHTEIQPS